jgi:PAS domain S-box-containing protein
MSTPQHRISTLYVDDEAALLDLTRIYLEKDGECSVTTALSGDDALRLLKDHAFEVVVSDYQMPEMDGIQLLKQIRSSGNTVPFIIFTGHGREDVVIEALNSGADFFLQKGGDPKVQFVELQSKIRHAVSHNRMEQSLRDSNRRLFDIINFLPDATFAIDAEGKVIAWNKAIEEMTGIPAQDMVGRSNYEYALPFYGERRPVLIDLVLTADEKVYPNWYPATKKEGDVLIAETSFTPPGGKRVVLLAKALILYDSTGGISGAIESIRDITATRKFEKAHRRSEQQYRELVENVNSVILTRDSNGAITFVNEYAERLFGYTHDELIGKQVIGTIVPPTESTGRDLVAHIKNISENPEKFHYNENENIKKDGTRLWMKWTNRAILDDSGKPAGVLSVGIDITEKKAAENALKESHEKYQALFELGGEAILLIDTATGTVLEANTGASEMYGYTRAELLQLRKADLSAEPVAAEPGTSVTPGDNGMIPLCYHRRKSGEIFPVEIHGRFFNWKGGKVQVAAIRDITVRQNTERALIESEERYRVLAEHAFDGVMIQDFSGTVLYANPRIVSMFGFSCAEDLIGQNALSLVAAESRTMVMRDMQNVSAGRGGHIQKYRAVRNDGSTVLIESVGTGITYRGEPANIIALRDITERERAEDSLRRANTKLNLLNSVTRHDVNNQVHALLGYIQLARMQNTDPMVTDFLTKAELAGSHITRQLEFTRMYQDLGLKDPQWQDLRGLVDKAAQKSVQFTNDCQNLEIFSDPMLENVFVNLVDNAIRHGEHVTQISVWCMEAENGIVIVVEDNGAGVPLALKAKIFDKGFGKHTGFGLFLAREVLAITGISIHETGVHGKGARFEIFVPNGTFRIVSDSQVAGKEAEP